MIVAIPLSLSAATVPGQIGKAILVVVADLS
jgi:hypothetical protein